MEQKRLREKANKLLGIGNDRVSNRSNMRYTITIMPRLLLLIKIQCYCSNNESFNLQDKKEAEGDPRFDPEARRRKIDKLRVMFSDRVHRLAVLHLNNEPLFMLFKYIATS